MIWCKIWRRLHTLYLSRQIRMDNLSSQFMIFLLTLIGSLALLEEIKKRKTASDLLQICIWGSCPRKYYHYSLNLGYENEIVPNFFLIQTDFRTRYYLLNDEDDYQSKATWRLKSQILVQDITQYVSTLRLIGGHNLPTPPGLNKVNLSAKKMWRRVSSFPLCW